MEIRTLAEGDVAPLAAGLAALPLMERYGRSAQRIAEDLRAARARGDGLLVAVGPEGPLGLAWFLPSGTLALGGYLKLIAVLGGAQGSGAGAAGSLHASTSHGHPRRRPGPSRTCCLLRWPPSPA